LTKDYQNWSMLVEATCCQKVGTFFWDSVHHYYGTQYCSIETVLLILPFLQTNITSQMWLGGGKGCNQTIKQSYKSREQKIKSNWRSKLQLDELYTRRARIINKPFAETHHYLFDDVSMRLQVCRHLALSSFKVRQRLAKLQRCTHTQSTFWQTQNISCKIIIVSPT